MKHFLRNLVFPINSEVSLTKEEKEKIWFRAQSIRCPGYLRRFLLLSLTIIIMASAYFLTLLWVGDWLIRVGILVGFTIILLPFPISIIYIGFGLRKYHKSSVRQSLREHGYDVCLNCGYWLKELPLEESKHCPECGEEREPLPELSIEADSPP